MMPSQMGYRFLMGLTAISWCSTKQSLTATSSNYSEIITLCEATRECLRLRKVLNHILENTGKLSLSQPTQMYEDNLTTIT